MKKLLALICLLFAVGSASAQTIERGTRLTAGSTPTSCTALQLFYADASSKFACMAGTSWDNTNRSLTITGATVTTSNPVLNLSQTWNNAGTTFIGLSYYITHTAASVSSRIIDLKVNNLDRFYVTRDGIANAQQFTAIGNTTGYFSIANASFLTLRSGGGWQIGNVDTASPTPQNVKFQSAVAGTTNGNGADATFEASVSTGSGTNGHIDFKTGTTGAAATVQNSRASALKLMGGTQEAVFGKNATFAEMTAPSAPAANGATLYCDDNGAGKTRCSILFATGAAQQIAIEP